MSLPQVAGFLAAVGGLAVLMVIAGLAWGVYTLLGRGVSDPVRTTARNFLACVPFGLLLGAHAGWGSDAPVTTRGVLLSILSGAVTSGVGYALWYAALRGHSRVSAAAVLLPRRGRSA